MRVSRKPRLLSSKRSYRALSMTFRRADQFGGGEPCGPLVTTSVSPTPAPDGCGVEVPGGDPTGPSDPLGDELPWVFCGGGCARVGPRGADGGRGGGRALDCERSL